MQPGVAESDPLPFALLALTGVTGLVDAVSEALLLVGAAIASIGFDIGSATPPGRRYTMIVLTALAMGLRNATVRRLAVPDLTTTVLTLTLTAVAADSSVAGGDNPRIGRRVASVVLMFAGAAVGTLLLRRGLALPLIVGAVGLLVATVAYADVPTPPPAPASEPPAGGGRNPTKVG